MPNAVTCQQLNDSVWIIWSGIVMMKHPVSSKLWPFSSDVVHEGFKN